MNVDKTIYKNNTRMGLVYELIQLKIIPNQIQGRDCQTSLINNIFRKWSFKKPLVLLYINIASIHIQVLRMPS